ncbi:cobalamin biosynthesis protein CobG [Streptomyces sp. NPDC017979]|uniref:cobalamin biosynthesis protein CobG n=1 Tax=Streptomyces sp. NPDC017979 TaxID=3365024 RepID=UPI0037B8CF9B
MLAAMAPSPSSPQATTAARERGDACPGTLRLHAADDGALARVRVPGGVVSVAQAVALAAASGRLGDGDLHLTSRGNVQLRGLREGCGGELAGALGAAGLLPAPGHERVRNVVASPLSGLDGRGLRDVRPWLVALDRALCASAAARELSGRFLFAVDDGRGDVAGLGADVTVRATADGGAVLCLGASGAVLRVSGQDAPRAAVLAAETFLATVRASGTPVWRVDELAVSADELAGEVRSRLAEDGIEVAGAAQREPAGAGGPAPGAHGRALSVHVPLGRLSAAQWGELVDVAAAGTAARGELRLTPWRGVVVPAPDLDAPQATAALDRLASAGLVVEPASPWLRVGACVGRPGCAKSRTDVRADATRALAAAGRAPLPVYWSGCERRCGRPRGDLIDAVAAPAGGYELTTAVRGRDPRTAPLDDPSDFATALAAIAP